MARRIVAVGVFLLALLGMPRRGDAGILELIWELSGPQLIGAGGSCLYTFSGRLAGCSSTAPKATGSFLVLGGSLFTSTGKNSDTQEYGWFDVNMATVEPGVAFFSRAPDDGVRIGHGVGISYGLLFGDNFRRFDKFAYTITPIELWRRKLGFAVKVRVYPNGFTDDEFGFGPRQDFNRPAETTIGFGFSYSFR